MKLEKALALATALAVVSPVFGEPRPRGSGPSPFDLVPRPVAATVRAPSAEGAEVAIDPANLVFRRGGVVALVDGSSRVVLDNLGVPAGLIRPAGLVAIAAEEETAVQPLKEGAPRPNLQLLVVEDSNRLQVRPALPGRIAVTPGGAVPAQGGEKTENQKSGGENK